jgi:ABC-type bacteriocin/lantibiotic exporter with double-glycine peptidase domain
VIVLGLAQVALFLALRGPTRVLAAQELDAQSRSQGHLVEMLAGFETLKAMGAEKRAVERWSHWFVDEINVTLARARLGSVAGALTSVLTTASPLAILTLGAWLVIEGRLSLGTMLALNALAGGFLSPLSNLVAVALQLQEARGHIDRIEDVLEAAPELPADRPLPAIRLQGAIEVQDVGFRYDAREPWVVSGVSVSILPGQKIAIVGRSGAGKSTLARLLVGLYRPECGRIAFDGVDLAGLDLRAIRAQIGMVTQDAHVFGMSIRDNLALADPTADLERLARAARLAEIDRDIEALPLGYGTPLTDGGASLSGGQRQRLALARALVGSPAILLLDEATSDLDTVTEARIMANLAELSCTRIVIAHRLSTVADADRILVLAQGQLLESGTHAQLLARKGHYAELVSAQLRPDP